mgnify:FL=1
MFSDKLFELAFIYKKTKLWKMLWDSEIFAVSLPDGEIGYCSIMGAIGEHCALGLYVGEKGLNSFRIVLSGPGMVSELNYHEFLLSQDCLQCAFENRDGLTEEEVEAARDYARRNRIALRGRNAFPHFVKFRPSYMPWFLRDEQDQRRLCAALEAAIEVAAQVEQKGKAALGLEQMNEDTASVPLLEKRNGTFVWSRIDLPPAAPVQYPQPQFINDITAAKLLQLKKNGMWECQVLRFPEPMQEDPACAPYFPVILMLVSGSMDEILPPQVSQKYDEEPEDLLEKFADLLLERQFRPALLSIRDERTHVLLKDFCARAGIRIRMCEDLPAIDEAVESLMSHLGVNDPTPDSVAEILDMLLSLDDAELSNLPDEIRQQFASILEQENLPDELTDELAGKLHLQTRRERRLWPEEWRQQSYVISVSCRKGCYRHIQISGGNTLEDLHNAIQDAFAFDNDHAYAFFMDNCQWSKRDAYYAPGIGQFDERSAGDFCLNQLDLEAGKQFKYLFDFGDEWVFQCRVLRVLEEQTEQPAVVRVQGEPPEQY